jgi:hypothetical protein
MIVPKGKIRQKTFPAISSTMAFLNTSRRASYLEAGDSQPGGRGQTPEGRVGSSTLTVHGTAVFWRSERTSAQASLVRLIRSRS